MYEVEIKVSADTDAVRKRLRAAGAERVDARRQRDAYYDAPHRDFAETDEALAPVRRETPLPDGIGAETEAVSTADPTAETTKLTYKGPASTGGRRRAWNTRDRRRRRRGDGGACVLGARVRTGCGSREAPRVLVVRWVHRHPRRGRRRRRVRRDRAGSTTRARSRPPVTRRWRPSTGLDSTAIRRYARVVPRADAGRRRGGRLSRRRVTTCRQAATPRLPAASPRARSDRTRRRARRRRPQRF